MSTKNGTATKNGTVNRIGGELPTASGPAVDAVLSRFASVKGTGFKRKAADGNVYTVKLKAVPPVVTPQTVMGATDTAGANVTREREVSADVGATENKVKDSWGFKPEDKGGVAVGYLLGYVAADELPPEHK
jgi:hypothetical protein